MGGGGLPVERLQRVRGLQAAACRLLSTRASAHEPTHRSLDLALAASSRTHCRLSHVAFLSCRKKRTLIPIVKVKPAGAAAAAAAGGGGGGDPPAAKKQRSESGGAEVAEQQQQGSEQRSGSSGSGGGLGGLLGGYGSDASEDSDAPQAGAGGKA